MEFHVKVIPGDRTCCQSPTGVLALQALLESNFMPRLLLVPKGKPADMWTAKTVDLFQRSGGRLTIQGKGFREKNGIKQISRQHLDYLISVHFPYIVPAEVLDLPRVGTLNLHPAFLPFNRGWHTPSWAIADNTPYGATLHWMDDGIDTGDIALQKQVAVRPDDTADSLYQRVLAAEIELFRSALPALANNALPRMPQTSSGTEHCKADLEAYQAMDLDTVQSVGETLTHLRALTTNSWNEAASFAIDGKQYRVRVEFQAVEDEALTRKAA